MGNSTSDWIWEVLAMGIVIIGLGFAFRVFTGSGEATSTLSQDIREGFNIRETGYGYENTDNTVSGSEAYYSVLDSDGGYSIYVDGSEISRDVIKKAREEDAGELIGMFDPSASYVKTYQRDASGNVTQVSYTRQ